MKKKLHYAHYVFWALPMLGLGTTIAQAESKASYKKLAIAKAEATLATAINYHTGREGSSAEIVKLADVTVTGRVTGENGEGLPGVTIQVKGTTQGTATDVEGNFSLILPDGNATLVVSYVGYATQEVAVNNRATVNISLATDAEALEEVVVIGYGTAQKSDVTGSLSSVTAEQIEQVPVQNITQALQGRAAGVDIAAGTFRPGEVPAITIRGNRSISATNEPLYVVDGIPLAQGSGLNDFNPLDIESIEILKDASSTAIYGSRGANGVVLVTTKKGREGKFSVNYDTYVSLDRPLVTLDLFDGPGFAELRRESYRNLEETNDQIYSTPYPNPADDFRLFGRDPYTWASLAMGYEWEDQENLIPRYRQATPEEQEQYGVTQIPIYNPANVRSTDWQDMALRDAVTQNHQIMIRGGSEKIRAAFSAGYLDQEGIQPGQDFKRYNTRLNVNYDVAKFLTMGASVNANVNIQNLGGNIYGRFISQIPLAVPYDSAGNFIQLPGADDQVYNPIREADLVFNERRTTRFFGSFYAEAKLLEGLRYRLNFGPDYRQTRNGTFESGLSAERQGTSRAVNNQSQNFTYVVENLLFYDKTFGVDHNLGVTLLQSIQKDRSESIGITATDFPYESQLWYNIGTTNQGQPSAFSSGYSLRTLQSWMGRVNYSFKDRYLLTASGRYDGSSVLAPGNQWDFFPSFALAWKAEEEEFLRDVAFINQLKLRVGYGAVGQSSIDPYQTGGILARTPYVWNESPAYGYAPSGQRLPDLSWEKTSTINAGIDFAFLDYRISGTVDVYRANTTNLIMPRSLPTASGFGSVLQNIGATRNTGIEVSLTTDNIRSVDGFNWSTDFIFTKNKEEFVETHLGEIDDVGNRWFIGQPLGVYYDYKFDGIWQADQADQAAQYGQVPGDIRVVDVNNDNQINAQDLMVLGSNRPKWSGSINNRFSYKGFELTFLVYARIGQMINNAMYRPGLGGRYQSIAWDYWTPTNPSNEFPRPIKDMDISEYGQSLQYQNGDFVKVRNISLNYTFPQSFVSKFKGSNLNVYVNVVNPFLFTDFEALDPEVTDPGTGTAENRRALGLSTRSFVFGLRVGF
ncbi:SusC/RagA family TonB-linked outer membrane protein [Pontibacter silvestris]|uniref:SusC/RagA family TonB-linked outer membrane protein n=1 Tax=Pontibacter silvestris TaxID=2305183 RepID=A0ABW4X111_9BACT|nr:TonB-dependent receptor [Pontibacter silvestris]MCC9135585.1 TonB-dependent receptor [Pontibacter silvestris]